ncbi:MAG: glycosyltransferase family 2 protein [Chthoniobacterales bacterium]|nr:glycosyltransferase family 2 protein [Chthoniobacterales bacterium]
MNVTVGIDAARAPLVSVVTCSHNPRPDYLARALSALTAQTVNAAKWEFVLVDSASAEPLASTVDLSWHPRARCVREDESGLTRARLRGIAESTGDLLVFVDDDNVLDPDFLEQALRIYRERPDIGSWSGATRPGFDAPAPSWTRRHFGNLVIREVPKDLWSNIPMLPETMPCGAGLCVRRSVAASYAALHTSGKRPFALDRNGTSLLSGGDNDLAACACDIGLGVGIFGALKLTHLIPANRLQERYLLDLAENIALSTVILRSFRSDAAVRVPSLKRRALDALRLLTLTSHERRIFLAVRRGERRAAQQLAVLSTQSVSQS